MLFLVDGTGSMAGRIDHTIRQIMSKHPKSRICYLEPNTSHLISNTCRFSSGTSSFKEFIPCFEKAFREMSQEKLFVFFSDFNLTAEDCFQLLTAIRTISQQYGARVHSFFVSSYTHKLELDFIDAQIRILLQFGDTSKISQTHTLSKEEEIYQNIAPSFAAAPKSICANCAWKGDLEVCLHPEHQYRSVNDPITGEIKYFAGFNSATESLKLVEKSYQSVTVFNNLGQCKKFTRKNK